VALSHLGNGLPLTQVHTCGTGDRRLIFLKGSFAFVLSEVQGRQEAEHGSAKDRITHLCSGLWKHSLIEPELSSSASFSDI